MTRLLLMLVALVLLVGARSPVAIAAGSDFLGIPGNTIGGTGIWTGVLLFLLYFLREYRETRKLSSEDRVALREGYAMQVAELNKENRSLRAELVENERRHDEYRRICEHEHDQLRGDVRMLENELAGFRRRLDSHGSARDRLAAPTVSRRLGDEGPEK